MGKIINKREFYFSEADLVKIIRWKLILASSLISLRVFNKWKPLLPPFSEQKLSERHLSRQTYLWHAVENDLKSLINNSNNKRKTRNAILTEARQFQWQPLQSQIYTHYCKTVNQSRHNFLLAQHYNLMII